MSGGKARANGTLTAADVASQRDREHKAVQLALAGATYEQIATECHYAGKSGAWKAVQRLLARVDAENAGQLRTVEGARLDRLQAAHWPAALRGDTKAAGVVLRILDRRARLFGLDAAAPSIPDQSAMLPSDQGTLPQIDDPLTALAQLAGEVIAFKDYLRGRLSAPAPSAGSTDSSPSLSVELARYERALERSGRLLAEMGRLDIDERLARVGQQQAEALAVAVRGALAELGQDLSEQRTREVLGRHLRAIQPGDLP